MEIGKESTEYLAVPFVFPSRDAEDKISGWLDGNIYRRPPSDLAQAVRYLLRRPCIPSTTQNRPRPI